MGSENSKRPNAHLPFPAPLPVSAAAPGSSLRGLTGSRSAISAEVLRGGSLAPAPLHKPQGLPRQLGLVQPASPLLCHRAQGSGWHPGVWSCPTWDEDGPERPPASPQELPQARSARWHSSCRPQTCAIVPSAPTDLQSQRGMARPGLEQHHSPGAVDMSPGLPVARELPRSCLCGTLPGGPDAPSDWGGGAEAGGSVSLPLVPSCFPPVPAPAPAQHRFQHRPHSPQQLESSWLH